MPPLDGVMDLGRAPELASYQDEPAQMPGGATGKDAYLRLAFAPRAGRTELVDLSRRTPLLVQQALHWDEAMSDLACVMVVSTSGGILQGDRYAIEITLEPDARAHITTQSAQKVQEMDANYATHRQHLTLHAGSYLEYLPEPTIPYRDSRFITDTTICVHPTATLLYGEILTPGRRHYRDGELFEYSVLSSAVRAHREDGERLFTEQFVVTPRGFDPRRGGVLGTFDVVGSVFVLAPPEICDRVLEGLGAELSAAADADVVAGISRLPNSAGLVGRILGRQTEPVKAKVREFWTAVRHEAVGMPVPPQFAWR